MTVRASEGGTARQRGRRRPTSSGLGDLDRLAYLAETLAGAWGARARASTTVGRERALLRLFGVDGVDRAGRPLANEVVDRYAGGRQDRLAAGVTLPFAMALLEYDLPPRQLALDVASGAIDLALEAELLAQPDRRAVAEQEARRLAAAAIDRFDANRTARRELVDLLGDARRPWIAATTFATTADRARREAAALARDGIDVVRVEVPVGRELAARLHRAGLEVPAWSPDDEEGAGAPGASERAPAGSQRGLAQLRAVLDDVAATGRGYIRLATSAPALAAPEQAVVAGFERIDLVESDPMAEIVTGRIDPDRVLADHAFAHRLHARSGALLVIGAGPLVVAPDLVTGVPSDAATRAGRALALQLLGVALARADGLAPAQIAVGALPDWLIGEPAPVARAAAEVTLRRALLAGHPLVFVEPDAGADRTGIWPHLLAGVLAPVSDVALVVAHRSASSAAPAVTALRAAASVASELASALPSAGLAGAGLDHARATAAAARETLERLGELGWRSVLGNGLSPGRGRLGAEAVVERSETFDPLDAVLRGPAPPG